MSGGQRQRAAVVARSCGILAFFSLMSLYPLSMRSCTRRRGEIARLHQQLGAMMLYVTHDQVEAMTLGDRIVVLEGGHVMQIDTPMNLYEPAKNTFVAGSIGSPAMKLIVEVTVAGLGVTGVELRAVSEDIEILREGTATSERAAKERVRLEVVGPLGSEAFLSARVGAKEIMARVPPRGLRAAGSEAGFRVNSERLHFFGERVARHGAGKKRGNSAQGRACRTVLRPLSDSSRNASTRG